MRFALVAALTTLLVCGCDYRASEPPPDPDSTSAPTAATALALDSLARSKAVMRPMPEPLALRLPTSNDALFYDESRFYAALDQHRVPGLREHGWEGGQYGFVRNPARGSRGYVFSRVHEGLDIRPLYFDARGEPTDTVRAVADGRVVYANRGRNSSSYGQYVVVRHTWDQTPVYSLYAHFERVDVSASDTVALGDPLGRLGYTGRGTAKHRAHVHLEIGLLLNEHFQRWFDRYYGGRNLHGLYFGRNIAGVDAASLYTALRASPSLTFSRFVRQRPVAFRLAIPGAFPLDVLARYPWLSDDGVTAADASADGAWVVSFTREAVPVRIARQAEPVARPEVVYVAPEVERRRLSTGGLLARGDSAYHLTREGFAFAALLATSERGVPPWF